MRLLGWTAFGVGCLLLVHVFRPGAGSLFTLPSDLAGWAWLLCGLTGIWLIPGLWLSAVIMRAGAGPTAWLATRIGAPLAWYALVGPIIHQLGEGARVTTGGIVIATVAATGAVCLGVALGISRVPTRSWQRIVACAAIAGVTSQIVIWIAMRIWNYDMNYAHIRRLDWLIVLGCAVLATAGMVSRPKQPLPRTARGVGQLAVAASILAAVACVLVLASTEWSPEQRMPSALALEQISAPEGADLAFAAAGIGTDGTALVQQAEFTVSDDTGRPLPAEATVEKSAGTADRAIVLIRVLPEVGTNLCTASGPAKLTVREVISGVRIQGVLPERWCGR